MLSFGNRAEIVRWSRGWVAGRSAAGTAAAVTATGEQHATDEWEKEQFIHAPTLHLGQPGSKRQPAKKSRPGFWPGLRVIPMDWNYFQITEPPEQRERSWAWATG